MSREHPYAYEIDNPTLEQRALMEVVTEDHVALGLYPERVCGAAAWGPEVLSIYLYCNKTKIKLYKSRLDEKFQADGRIRNLRDEVYEDDDADMPT